MGGHAEVFDELGDGQDLEDGGLVDVDRLGEAAGLRPIDGLIVIEVISELTAEHLEYLIKLSIQAAIRVNVLENAPGLSHSLLDELELLHLVVFFSVGLRVATFKTIVFTFALASSRLALAMLLLLVQV